MLSLVKQAHHMHENHYFICHKVGCSIRNHPGYNHNRPTGSWRNNLKPSQTAHTRAVSTTSHLTPNPSHQDNPLNFFLKNVTKTQGYNQVLLTLRFAFNTSLDKQGNPLANKQPTAKKWDESARILTIEATFHIPFPDYHDFF